MIEEKTTLTKLIDRSNLIWQFRFKDDSYKDVLREYGIKTSCLESCLDPQKYNQEEIQQCVASQVSKFLGSCYAVRSLASDFKPIKVGFIGGDFGIRGLTLNEEKEIVPFDVLPEEIDSVVISEKQFYEIARQIDAEKGLLKTYEIGKYREDLKKSALDYLKNVEGVNIVR